MGRPQSVVLLAPPDGVAGGVLLLDVRIPLALGDEAHDQPTSGRPLAGSMDSSLRSGLLLEQVAAGRVDGEDVLALPDEEVGIEVARRPDADERDVVAAARRVSEPGRARSCRSPAQTAAPALFRPLYPSCRALENVSISSLRTSAGPTTILVDRLLLEVDVLDIGVDDVLGDPLDLLVGAAAKADLRVELRRIRRRDAKRALGTAA